MSDLTDTDFPPLEPQPFITEEGREIERLRAELAAAIKQRDEARRLWCIAVEEIESGMTNETRYEVAESKGWDCFAQQEGGGA